jgi:ATP-dependent Lon protease
METISLPGYVAEEKLYIATSHLWPKILKENGLSKFNVKIPDKALNKIVSEYTREAGVRSLDRQLSRVARKLATKIVKDSEEGKKLPQSVTISISSLKDYLGAPKTHEARLPRRDSVGAALGLAWTEAGGDVLVIESAVMKGAGKVIFTGNLGDIMQESAQAALGYLRSCAAKYHLNGVDWEKTDIHVHVPEGAIPKDGPSAGVTLALAMLSALSGRIINSHMAMTGEITLRGTVLPIGGVKEKVLAARRNGITSVILPRENKVDVDELAEWARDGMVFNYVSDVDEVFRLTLEKRAGN